MKPLLLLAAASLLPLAACASKAPPRAALDCPATQGALTRTSAADDGKTCVYASADGAEVTLRLIPVAGSAFATLDRLESTLLAEADKAPTGEAVAVAETAASATSIADARRIESEAAKDAAAVQAPGAERSDDGVDVRVEAGKVVVKEGGSTTRVNLPGVRIEADEDSDSASIRIGPMHIDANGDEARLQVRRDVRLKGESLSREKRGVRATFIVGGRQGENRSFVGYEAGGPKTGPLAVAIVRSNQALDTGDDVLDDVKRLVRKNGGV
ncbi:hypothetical protein LRS10_18430 [Phenylobacterium sp. J426]|uniref:hypothetical protein n=1 Tax=Phenylobacterium sp. J426 TaxID=2898439 RepID=UPI0021515749|nr:hypothetical protein [Phenylobacterium sp. J426]MCR5875953.1 hypothetical protein [Phenylobacterium sp. J426]